MPFLPPNQQRQSTEGNCQTIHIHENESDGKKCDVSWKVVQIDVILRLQRRMIDHKALWTGVCVNRMRPAYTLDAGEQTPNTLSVV